MPTILPNYAPNLEDAGKLQIVEHRQEDVGGHGNHYHVAQAHHDVHRAVLVHLCRSSQYGDGAHETRQHRQRHRKRSHVTVGQQELLCGGLFTPRTRVVHSYHGRYTQHAREHHIIPSGKHI